MRFVLIAIVLLATGHPCFAALTRSQLATVGVTPAKGAQVPLALSFNDFDGSSHTLGEVIGNRPALLIIADYRCTQLCGSVLGIAARALSVGGLSPGRDYALVVVGFNPEASSADAKTMRDQELAAYPELRVDAHLLTGSAASVEALTKSVKFTAVRDSEAGRFAHPVDLYVLTPEGNVSRVLNGLALDPDTVRLALVEAGQGRIGSLVDRLHVLCYGLDPLTGASTALAQAMLRTGATLTLIGAGGLAVFALRRRAFRARAQP
jgi:protein SCO1/2